MTIYYAVMAALAVINFLLFYMGFREKKINFYMLSMLALIMVSNGGNLAMAMSESLAEAYIAKKIHYIGACFIPPIMLMVILYP